ncbi:hypothetical protein ACWDE0_26105 [Streptomyces sp. 900105755]
MTESFSNAARETQYEDAEDAQASIRALSPWATAVIGLLLGGQVSLFSLALLSIWSVMDKIIGPAAVEKQTETWSPFGLGHWHITPDVGLLIIVMICSGLGSFVHAATSFASYVGNRRMYASWIWWYLLRTGIGMALALLVYLLLRGGLFAGEMDGRAANPYGFAGIAGLCGLFSKQATDKLREVFDTILSTRGDGDSKRFDKLGETSGHDRFQSSNPGESP